MQTSLEATGLADAGRSLWRLRNMLGRSLLMEASLATSCGCWAQTARAELESQGHYLATLCPRETRAVYRVGFTQEGASGNPRWSFLESWSLLGKKVVGVKEAG